MLHDCLATAWKPFPADQFWADFRDHPRKLNSSQAGPVTKSMESLELQRLVTGTQQSAQSMHDRKLHGLYVDFKDGKL